jgi:hypothetical protein
MRLWIRDTDDTDPMTHRKWKLACWYSFATELWKPLGTRAPRWWSVAGAQPWTGSYLVNDDPVLSGEDCANLAAGLEAFIAQIPTGYAHQEPSAQIPLDLRLIDDEDRYASGPYVVRLSGLLHAARNQENEFLPLIEFLRRVPSTGELVVHYPEITVRRGHVVGAP